MPQFDFYIFLKIIALIFLTAAFISSTAILINMVSRWVGLALRSVLHFYLNGKVTVFGTVGNFSRIALECAASLFAFDLMEQFTLYMYKQFASHLTLLTGAAIFIVLLALSTVFLKWFRILLDFVLAVAKDALNEKGLLFTRNYLVGLASIFLAVLVFNFVGILPFSFTFTSSLIAPFAFSFTAFGVYTSAIIWRHKSQAFAGFLPAGTSIFIGPLIAFIEIISTIAKFISLGIRLFANMFAGHLLLKVFYSLGFGILAIPAVQYVIVGVTNFGCLVLITILEVLIAFLQAFVILLLCVLYFKESISFVESH